MILVLCGKRECEIVVQSSILQSWLLIHLRRHSYICKTRPALEMLSPPPAVWLASVHTRTGATQTSTVILSLPGLSISSQQETGFSLLSGILVPDFIDVEKLSSIIRVALRRSIYKPQNKTTLTFLPFQSIMLGFPQCTYIVRSTNVAMGGKGGLRCRGHCILPCRVFNR